MDDEKLTWEALADRLDLLNASAIARRAGIPRHRIADAQRDRATLTPAELDRIKKVLDALKLRN